MASRNRHAGQFAAGQEDRPILPPSLANSLADTVLTVSGLILLAIIAAAWVSILSWSMLDPSFTRIATAPPKNWLGLPGAYLADVGLQTLGFGVFTVLLAPMFWAIALARRERLTGLARQIVFYSAGVLLVSTAASAWATVPGWPLSYGLGGIAGDRLMSLSAGPLVPLAGEFAKPAIAAAFSLAGLFATLSACGVNFRSKRSHGTGRKITLAEPEFERPSRMPVQRAHGFGALDTDTRRWGPDPLEPVSRDRMDPPHLDRWGTVQDAPAGWSATDGAAPVFAKFDQQIPSNRALRQYGPYAHTAHEPQSFSDADQLADPDFDAWTDASSSGIAARFAPVENAPRSMQNALTSAFGQGPGPLTSGRSVGWGARRSDRERAAEAYRRPSLNLLARPVPPRSPSAYAQSLVRGNSRLLVDALAEFGIEGHLQDIEHGPVITAFLFEIARGTKLSRVIALADDIARHLGAPALRIVERPGRGLIAIEMPNTDRAPVMLRDCLESDAYRSEMDTLPIALGLSSIGEPVIANLAHMPALLVTGGEGTAKATGLNAMILSLIYRHGPEDCRFLMIDPRMVDLAVYDGIPHLLTPVVGDPHKAITALGWCVREMEERVKRMAALGVRNIEMFNNRVRNAKKRGEPLQRSVQTGFDDRTGKARFETEVINIEPMPHIVIVVEELADLMAVAGRDIEASVSRLAKAARAVGIHLIVATERPTSDIVTATIRASLPARLSYKASNRAESRSSLGHEGAEVLLPGGDSLLATGQGLPVRVHGPSVSAEEVSSVAMSLKERGTTRYVADVVRETPPAGATGSSPSLAEGPSAVAQSSPMDDLYDRAVAIAVRDGGASIGHLQATLKVSSGWAASLLARLEADGVIGPADPRGRHGVLPPGRRSVA